MQTHTCMQTCMQTYGHVDMHACIHTCTHTDACIQQRQRWRDDDGRDSRLARRQRLPGIHRLQRRVPGCRRRCSPRLLTFSSSPRLSQTWVQVLGTRMDGCIVCSLCSSEQEAGLQSPRRKTTGSNLKAKASKTRSLKLLETCLLDSWLRRSRQMACK